MHEHGYVSTESLAERFDVTAQTIRRDINLLCEKGLLVRYHGGAGINTSVANLTYSTRKDLHREEKRSIAAMVAARLPNHASLFLDIGTTSEEIARALQGHQGLRVITNNLNVAVILSENETFEVTVCGGRVRSRDNGLVGEGALEFLEQFKVDFCVLTLSGIDAEGQLLDYDYSEVKAMRVMMRNARSTYLAADHSKFTRTPLISIAHIGEVDIFFTDRRPSDSLCRILREKGVELVLPGEGKAEDDM